MVVMILETLLLRDNFHIYSLNYLKKTLFITNADLPSLIILKKIKKMALRELHFGSI
jgi:hypothetical protein